MEDTFIQWVGLYVLTLATVAALSLFSLFKCLDILQNHLDKVHAQNEQIAELLRIIMRRLE